MHRQSALVGFEQDILWAFSFCQEPPAKKRKSSEEEGKDDKEKSSKDKDEEKKEKEDKKKEDKDKDKKDVSINILTFWHLRLGGMDICWL